MGDEVEGLGTRRGVSGVLVVLGDLCRTPAPSAPPPGVGGRFGWSRRPWDTVAFQREVPEADDKPARHFFLPQLRTEAPSQGRHEPASASQKQRVREEGRGGFSSARLARRAGLLRRARRFRVLPRRVRLRRGQTGSSWIRGLTGNTSHPCALAGCRGIGHAVWGAGEAGP